MKKYLPQIYYLAGYVALFVIVFGFLWLILSVRDWFYYGTASDLRPLFYGIRYLFVVIMLLGGWSVAACAGVSGYVKKDTAYARWFVHSFLIIVLNLAVVSISYGLLGASKSDIVNMLLLLFLAMTIGSGWLVLGALGVARRKTIWGWVCIAFSVVWLFLITGFTLGTAMHQQDAVAQELNDDASGK